MYGKSNNWIEQVKFIVEELLNSRSFVLEGIISSVDPRPPYKAKVVLEPYGFESGWLKISTPYVGNGFGLIMPPPEEGTAVKVIFDMGDIKNGTIIGSVFNSNVQMPNVTAGTGGLVHKSGSSILIAPDGLVTIKGKNSTQSW